jgi:small-conductance mechanosensitive channel
MSLYIALTAAILLAALRFTGKFLRKIPANPSLHRFMIRAYPLVEFAIWLIFGLWALNYYLGKAESTHIILVGALLMLVAAAGWYFFRDYTAGIILKTEMPLEINQTIRTAQVRGTLKKLGYRSAEIENESGQRLRVPYSQLTTGIVALESTGNGLKQHEVEIHVDARLPIQEVKDDLIREILCMPWVSCTIRPAIRVSDQSPATNTYLARFYVLSERHAAYAEEHLKKRFEGSWVAGNIPGKPRTA